MNMKNIMLSALMISALSINSLAVAFGAPDFSKMETIPGILVVGTAGLILAGQKGAELGAKTQLGSTTGKIVGGVAGAVAGAAVGATVGYVAVVAIRALYEMKK